MTEPLDIHLLNATGRLRPLVSFLHTRIRSAHEEAARHLPLLPVDIVVAPENDMEGPKGARAQTPNANTVFVTVDPDHDALLADDNRAFERLIAHALHHAARHSGPGCGKTLGEALVTEGLAFRFVREVYGPPHDPAETALHPFDLAPHRDAALKDWNRPCDRSTWFDGAGDRPIWTGYTLGVDIVERHLADHPHDNAVSLVHSSAEWFRPS